MVLILSDAYSFESLFESFSLLKIIQLPFSKKIFRAAALLSRYRPPVPIFAVCRDRMIRRQLHLWRGIYPLYFEGLD